MGVHEQELWERFAELDELPYGAERIAAHLALSERAESTEDYSLRCKLLIWISDDYMETGDRPRMAEYFDRAWALFRAHREEVDEYVRYNLRTTFGPTIEFLDSSPEVPAEVVAARLDELDGFYRDYGYSMRIPHRTRYWFHRRREEREQAAAQLELMLAAPGDAGARCDAMGPVLSAQWYQGPGGDKLRAAELWRSVLRMADQRCREDHRAQAYAELMFLAVQQDRGGEARSCHRAGYPLIRRVQGGWRSLDLHMIYALRVRDLVGFVRIVHDHVELLDAPLDEDVSWYQGRVLQFLHLLAVRGHGALPLTLADRSETTAQALRERLDAALSAHAQSQAEEAERTRYTERLAGFRDRILDKVALPAEEEDDEFWDATLPPVPAPWAAPPDLEDLPKGWSSQDALLADARVLAYLDHPHKDGAWAAVGALGSPRSLADQARLAEYRSDFLVREGDYASGRAMRLLAAELLERAERPNRALYNRMLAALAVYLTKDQPTALAERDAVLEQAVARHAAGLMTDGELLEIRVEDFRLNSIIEIMTYGANRNDVMDNTETNAKFSAGTKLYLDKKVAHAPLASLVDAWGFYRQQMSRLYQRYGVLPEFVRDTTAKVDFWYGKSRDGYRDAMQFTQEAERELERGKNLLDAELYEEAEHAALEALRLNAGLAHKEYGEIRLLQAQSIAWRLGAETDRDAELLEAAREAAALLGGKDERAAGNARVLVGDVHRRAGRLQLALEVYDGAVRSLATSWDNRPARLALRRATAGLVVCLRGLDRAAEAQAKLDGLVAELPEWNQVTVGWIRHDVGLAYQHLGRYQEAMAEYEEAVRIAQACGELDPHCSALLHAAELSAPRDPKAAMSLLDDAVALLGRFIEADQTARAEADARRARRAVENGRQPEPVRQPEPDPAKLARQALAKAAKVRLLIEPEPAPDDVLERLLPDAYRAAAEGVETLAGLMRAAAEDDPRRAALMARLESAIGSVATVQGGMGDSAGAAARFTAFAALAEECGFPGFATTAKENAQAMGVSAG
jgi:tetratricopeptide (TPR) repeat protein